jgi:hypothetical protein
MRKLWLIPFGIFAFLSLPFQLLAGLFWIIAAWCHDNSLEPVGCALKDK